MKEITAIIRMNKVQKTKDVLLQYFTNWIRKSSISITISNI